MRETHDYDWIITKVNDQKSDSSYFGMVSEVHEIGSATFNDEGTPGLVTNFVEHVLVSPLKLEPGDYFLIGYWDKDLAGNPNVVAGDPNQGRMNFVTAWNGDVLNQRMEHTRWITSWMATISALPEIGYTNNGPFNGNNYVWAIDFEASFF